MIVLINTHTQQFYLKFSNIITGIFDVSSRVISKSYRSRVDLEDCYNVRNHLANFY